MPNGGYKLLGGKPSPGALHTSRSRKEVRYVFDYQGKKYFVARLVCEAFNGPPPFTGAICMHIDENSQNNRPDNLTWGTKKENSNFPGFVAYCKTRTGKNNSRVKAGATKLTESQVRRIRTLRVSQSKIAEIFGVSRSNIGLILQRKTWGHVSE